MLKSFGFILGAVRQKKAELLISLAMVLILLLVASVLMYFIEKEAQPEAFSDIFSTMWWGVATLTTVGYGDIYPITPVGKLLGGVIAILGVGLFALPAGIIASGFVEAMEEQKKLKSLMLVEAQLKHAFTVEYFVPVRNVKIRLGVDKLPRKWLSMNDIKYKMGISEATILDVIDFSKLFRLRNVKLGDKETAGLEFIDCNRSYGCFDNRQSNITIINLYAAIQPYFGHFSSGVAHLLQANYLSNEVYSKLSFLQDKQLNLINNPDYLAHIPSHPSLKDFQQDILKAIKADSFCVVFVSAARNETLFSLNTAAAVGTGNMHEGPFFKKPDALEKLKAATSKMAASYDMHVLTHEKFGAPETDHMSWWVHKETGCNLLLLHVNVSILKKKMAPYYQYMVELADCLRSLQ